MQLATHNHDYAIAHLANFVGQNSEIAEIYARWIGIVSVIIGTASRR